MANEDEQKAQDQSPTDATGGQPLDPFESAKELRELASAVEMVGSEALAGLADLEFPLSTGNLKEFPRAAPELRAAEEGLIHLQDAVQHAAAMLYALAVVREQGQDIPPVLRAAVQPFIVAVRARQ